MMVTSISGRKPLTNLNELILTHLKLETLCRCGILPRLW